MKGKNQHVVPFGGGWAVKSAGSQKATVITQKQADAKNYAKGIAKQNGSELIVHGRNGQIRERNSYGHDPHPPKDKKH